MPMRSAISVTINASPVLNALKICHRVMLASAVAIASKAGRGWTGADCEVLESVFMLIFMPKQPFLSKKRMKYSHLQ